MPGDYEQKFANLRNLMCWQMFHPGKKLLFMGSEFAQFIEWRFNEPLEWFLLDYPMHACTPVSYTHLDIPTKHPADAP